MNIRERQEKVYKIATEEAIIITWLLWNLCDERGDPSTLKRLRDRGLCRECFTASWCGEIWTALVFLSWEGAPTPWTPSAIAKKLPPPRSNPKLDESCLEDLVAGYSTSEPWGDPEGKTYRAIPFEEAESKRGGRKRCANCAFREREDGGISITCFDLPSCDASTRSDGKNVYFKEKE